MIVIIEAQPDSYKLSTEHLERNAKCVMIVTPGRKISDVIENLEKMRRAPK